MTHTDDSFIGADFSQQDIAAMKAAIKLSKRGYPAPNPHVGCVIVKDGKIIGTGYHDYAGGPHAERVAIADAHAHGASLEGSTAYVSLEPCAHTGRTPPCTAAIIYEGIARVVFAVKDPNPPAAGGESELHRAGILVQSGLLESLAEKANQPWLTSVRNQRPYVWAKAAIGLDGRIALSNGESQWITNEAARRAGHKLRAKAGCVLVGRTTYEQDKPQLTARIGDVKNQPLGVVIDPQGKISPEELFEGHISIVSTEVDPINGLDLNSNHEMEPKKILEHLFQIGQTGVLIEGGGKTLGKFIQESLVDELHLFIAPKVLLNGPTWATGKLEQLNLAPTFEFLRFRKISSDLELIFKRSDPL